MANYKDGTGNYKGGGGVTITTQSKNITSNITTTSTSFEDATGMTLTLANRSGGKFVAIAELNISHGTTGNPVFIRFNDGGTTLEAPGWNAPVAAYTGVVTLVITGDLDGGTLKIEWKTNAGTATMYGIADNRSHIEVYEIS